MSPRSEEFMVAAREALRAAQLLVADDLGARAVSEAYYAMLYAARAALSEEDLYAKTHRGVWHLFHQTFVAPGRFKAELHARAQKAQPRREAVDYEAASVTGDAAVDPVALAATFVAAVEAMLGAQR